MEHIATTFSKRRADDTLTSCAIVHGGLVTLFASEIPCFDETRHPPVLGPTLIDYAYLDCLYWLERAGDRYQWRINGMRSIELPNPLVKIRLVQPHYHLPIAGTYFPNPIPKIFPCTFHRRPPILRISPLLQMLPLLHIPLFLLLLILRI